MGAVPRAHTVGRIVRVTRDDIRIPDRIGCNWQPTLFLPFRPQALGEGDIQVRIVRVGAQEKAWPGNGAIANCEPLTKFGRQRLLDTRRYLPESLLVALSLDCLERGFGLIPVRLVEAPLDLLEIVTKKLRVGFVQHRGPLSPFS